MIEFADGLDRLLEFLIIGQPAAHLGNPLAAHAELTRAVARIRHGQHENVVAFTARIWGSLWYAGLCAPIASRAATRR
jgi:hypothetical protein